MDDDHDDRLGCFVTGTALNNDIYRFVQFHFHWRNSHSSGSEHAINGNKFTMEVCLLCLFVPIFSQFKTNSCLSIKNRCISFIKMFVMMKTKQF